MLTSAGQLKAGMSNVNGMSLVSTLGWGFNYLCQSLPFGGMGMSGFDRFGGVEGLRGNCNIRSATTDKFKGLRTGVPGITDSPIKSNSTAIRLSFRVCWLTLCMEMELEERSRE
jgi:hypothetical protein